MKRKNGNTIIKSETSYVRIKKAYDEYHLSWRTESGHWIHDGSSTDIVSCKNRAKKLFDDCEALAKTRPKKKTAIERYGMVPATCSKERAKQIIQIMQLCCKERAIRSAQYLQYSDQYKRNHQKERKAESHVPDYLARIFESASDLAEKKINKNANL